LSNCSVFDTGCFPGAVFDAFQVCNNVSDIELGETTTTTRSSCSGKLLELSMESVIVYMTVLTSTCSTVFF
jgi:hypothetical protein